MKLAAIEARIKDALFERWLREAGITPGMWSALEGGVPESWAEAIAADLPVAVSDWPVVLHGDSLLTKRLLPSRVKTEMDKSHKLSISRGAGADAFRRKCNDAGLTQNALAKRLGISKGRLSQYRRTADPEAIPAKHAARIKSLIGWPDDAAHWPGGIS